MAAWNADRIVTAISRQVLDRKCVVLVPRCNWTGYECDVLAVTTDLRIIDVEVKISRSDFKADAKKEKWWHRLVGYSTHGPERPRLHPPKVWKHYVAMPREVLNSDDLFAAMPSPASGLLLVREHMGRIEVNCHRRATPSREAERITPAACIDIARLANLRMWDALDRQAKGSA